MQLTNDAIKDLDYEGEELRPGKWTQHIVWDDLSGFGVRLYPSGVKSFVFKYVTDRGTQRMHTFGRFCHADGRRTKDMLSASEARRRAEELRVVVRDGGDPRQEKVEARDGLTVRQLGAEYVEKYAKQRKKSWAQDLDRLERHVYRRWGSFHPAEVSRAEVAKMHREIADGVNTYKRDGSKSKGGKVEANRTLALVSKLFNWAAKQGFVGGENPAEGVEKFREKRRERWIKPDEMPWVLAAVDEQTDEFTRAFFWFVLLTGARKSEAMDLRWGDVHLGRKEVVFRDTKNGTDHLVPLSKPAADLLESLPQIDGNPHVFAGRIEGQPLQSMMKAWVASASALRRSRQRRRSRSRYATSRSMTCGAPSAPG